MVFIGNINPLRYRGYYYDTGTGVTGKVLVTKILALGVLSALMIEFQKWAGMFLGIT